MRLGAREREVLTWIARGATNARIAAEMGITEASVKSHLGRIFRKLGARTRLEALVTALRRGLVELEPE